MNVVLPYHKGILLQKGKGISGLFISLFTIILPIGKTVLKSSQKYSKVNKESIGKKNYVNHEKSCFEYRKKY